MTRKPKIVCICGSTRFRSEIEEVNKRETLAGNIVLAPGVFGHSGDSSSDGAKTELDELHLRKIDLADEVIVVTVGGYVGESTRKEIEYASAIRRIRFAHFERKEGASDDES